MSHATRFVIRSFVTALLAGILLASLALGAVQASSPGPVVNGDGSVTHAFMSTSEPSFIMVSELPTPYGAQVLPTIATPEMLAESFGIDPDDIDEINVNMVASPKVMTIPDEITAIRLFEFEYNGGISDIAFVATDNAVYMFGIIGLNRNLNPFLQYAYDTAETGRVSIPDGYKYIDPEDFR